jgi:radical SAM protein with 4Fe4S-binding SPASM domain
MSGKNSPVLPHTLRLVAWEVTRSCNLACGHCRASAVCEPYAGELDTEKCKQILDEIATVGKPVIILTGGEPLLRPDIYEIAAYGDRKGLRMVLATNGTLVTGEVAAKLIRSGIRRVSVSIDGPEEESHDAFRGAPGAFAGAMTGIAAMKQAGLEFQINTTITKANLPQIREIHGLAHRLGAAAHHIFLLVPTGRAKQMADQEITPLAYEETLNWFYEEGLSCAIQLKATCAPHYYRIFHQRRKEIRMETGGISGAGPACEGERSPERKIACGKGGAAGRVASVAATAEKSAVSMGALSCRPPVLGKLAATAVGEGAAPVVRERAAGEGGHPLHTMTRGCLGGSAFCFISHRGQVQPCGYLELDCGQVTERGFAEIWNESAIFQDLRDLGRYKGKCGRCEFIRVCGGCRARAYETTGDYLAEEPFCVYEPGRTGQDSGGEKGG